MSDVRLKVQLEPLDDGEFHAAVDAALAFVRAGQTPIGSPLAAGLAEEQLRAAGYRNASVTWHEAPDDTLGLKAVWSVRRDG